MTNTLTLKPVAYFRATKGHGIVWGEDCCCADAIFDGDDNYDEQETFSLPVYSADVVEALQKENAAQKKRVEDLVKAYDREIDDCLAALKERDYWYDKADLLADKISECFDVPVGEHSNVNCPFDEANKILDGEYVTKFDKQIKELKAENEALRKIKEAAENLFSHKDNYHNEQKVSALANAVAKLNNGDRE